jgi:hypothetical protein
MASPGSQDSDRPLPRKAPHKNAFQGHHIGGLCGFGGRALVASVVAEGQEVAMLTTA